MSSQREPLYFLFLNKNPSQDRGYNTTENATIYLRTFRKALRNHCRKNLGQVSYIHFRLTQSYSLWA